MKTNYLPIYTTKIMSELNEEEKIEYQKIREKIIQLKINNKNLNIDKTYLRQIIDESIGDSENILKKINYDIKGYGKIENLLEDDNLEEIMIIGDKKPIYVYHRQKGMMITDLTMNNSEIRHIIEKIATNVQRKIDKQTPILDARLSDGSRINATIPPVSTDGPTLTIRKFKKDPYSIFDLINNKTISVNLAAFLWLVIEGMNVKPSNIIIAGGTGSGKTTTLNTLTSFIPPRERIITIEDTLEMQIPHEHIIRTETRPPNIENKGEINMDILLKNSLRQRPDRIIVGEVRSQEAITLFTALNTGHSGMGTLHANSSHETINRLINPPMNVPNIMINSIDFIIMQNRFYKPEIGTIRRITEVAEVVGMEMNQLQLNKIYQYNYGEDKLEYTAVNCKALNDIAKMKNITNKEIIDEISNREKYLTKFLSNNTTNIDHVQKIINNYYINQNN